MNHATVDRLMGSNSAFPEETYDLMDLLVARRLYLVDVTERRGLALVPFVKMMPGPAEEEDSCYFFSRVEDGVVRLLSYHDLRPQSAKGV